MELPEFKFYVQSSTLWICSPNSTFPSCPISGLPFDYAETDVVEFFHGLDIVMFFLSIRTANLLGKPFVFFALPRNRQNMGRRYVEVFRSKRQEYYKAIANEVSDAHGGFSHRRIPRAKSHDEGKDSAVHTGILQLRGLPFSAG